MAKAIVLGTDNGNDKQVLHEYSVADHWGKNLSLYGNSSLFSKMILTAPCTKPIIVTALPNTAFILVAYRLVIGIRATKLALKNI